jgi:large subunit ribosomal protein L34
MAIHYHRRISKVKRARQYGFRARMKSRHGRKMINRRRSIGRRINAKGL